MALGNLIDSSAAVNMDDPSNQLMGFPTLSGDSYTPPGFSSTQAAIPPAPDISSNQSTWDTVTQDARSALKWSSDALSTAENTAVSGIKSAYQGTKNVVGTVAGDIANPIGGVLKTTYLYIIVGVVILAGALYFVGRGGLKIKGPGGVGLG